MSEVCPRGDGFATPREQKHRETAHHEIRTTSTVLQSNADLARIKLRHEAAPATHIAVQRHLTELDLAVERLKRLAPKCEVA